jgi:single-stranded-DNA-specific exonuclease
MENNLLESILDRLAPPPARMNRPVLVMDGNAGTRGFWASSPPAWSGSSTARGRDQHPQRRISKGSARSIDGIDISAALNNAGSLDRFGGHPLAAGLSLPTANINAFRDRLERLWVE